MITPNMRLIDANAMRTDQIENGENECVYDTNAVLDSIDSQPTIEVEPVRHGQWIPTRPYMYSVKCTICGKIWELETPYCPSCGAKMDLEEPINE